MAIDKLHISPKGAGCFNMQSFSYLPLHIPAPYYSHKNGVNFFCGSCGLGFYVFHTLDAYFIILPAHHFNSGD